MGELTDQLFAGGPELLDLNDAQRRFFQEQRRFGDDLRWNLEKLQDSIREGVHRYCASTPGFGQGLGSCDHFLADYEHYIMFVNSGGDGPLSEGEFRDVLAWAGHGPSLVHDQWIAVFQAAVKQQRKWQQRVLGKELKSAPPNTFLARVVEAAK
mgnify:FL=1